MFNADCHVRVVYLIMCKPITLLHATLYVLLQYCMMMIAPTALTCVYVLCYSTATRKVEL